MTTIAQRLKLLRKTPHICARQLLREGKLGAFTAAFAPLSDAVNASAQDLIRRMAKVKA